MCQDLWSFVQRNSNFKFERKIKILFEKLKINCIYLYEIEFHKFGLTNLNYCYFELSHRKINTIHKIKENQCYSSVTGLSRENKSVIPRSRCTGEAIRQGQWSSREN